jgi:hypothetical protein
MNNTRYKKATKNIITTVATVRLRVVQSVLIPTQSHHHHHCTDQHRPISIQHITTTSQVKSIIKKMDSMSALSNSFETDHYERNLIVPVSNTNNQQTTTHNQQLHSHSHSHSQQQQQQGEHAPAYRLLLSRNLLVTRYRKDTFEDVFLEEDLEPNSTHADNFQKRWRWGVYWTPGCGLVVYVSRSKSSKGGGVKIWLLFDICVCLCVCSFGGV